MNLFRKFMLHTTSPVALLLYQRDVDLEDFWFMPSPKGQPRLIPWDFIWSVR